MAGNILTPVSIWGDFKITGERNYTVLNETVRDGVIFTRFTIDGKKTDGAASIIYLVSARSENLSISPCVFVLPDFIKDIDEDFLFDLAKRGYYAVSADFSGQKQGKKYYTVYPSGSEFANYENVKNSLYEISSDVKQSAWYEWGAVAKYVISYLTSNSLITDVGTVGVGLGASVLWQIAPSSDIACAAFLFDAGWNAYFSKRNYKYDATAPDFNDNDLKVLAGVDAQAFALFMKVPSFVITATNSCAFDFDRSADTVLRMSKAPYAAIDYSVNMADALDASAYKGLNVFLSEFLFKGSKAEQMPAMPEIECYLEEGVIEIEAGAATEGLKKVTLYAAEGGEVQQLRCWRVAGEIEADEYCDGQFLFRYVPYCGSGISYFFVRAEYESGLTLSSVVASKKFTEKDVNNPYKSKIIYSGREIGSASVFAPVTRSFAPFDGSVSVREEKGPMDIVGLRAVNGIITYKINAAKDKPEDDSVFLFDVCAECGAEITFSLLTGENFSGTEFFAKISCPAINAWRNFTLPILKFKSDEGLGLKNFSSVTAIKITSTQPFLINNFLWI